MASLVARMVKNPPVMWETWVWSMDWKDPLEKRMAIHSSFLAWRILWTRLYNSMKLWAMPCRATRDGWVMMDSSDKMWSTGEGNSKPLQYSCLENPMNSMKRQKDSTLKDEFPRLVGAQYATGDQWRNYSGKNEAAAAAKSLQLCPTLCDPIDGSPPGSRPWDFQARILKWFAFPFSSGPHFIRTLHRDSSVLGGPTWHGSYRLWSMCSFWLVFCDCGFLSVCLLMEEDKRFVHAFWCEGLAVGKAGSYSVGRAMLSKSLIQFSADGWGCAPSL